MREVSRISQQRVDDVDTRMRQVIAAKWNEPSRTRAGSDVGQQLAGEDTVSAFELLVVAVAQTGSGCTSAPVQALALTFFLKEKNHLVQAIGIGGASENVARRGGGKAKQGAPWSHHPVRALVSAEHVEVTSESDSRHELGRCKTLSKLGLAQGGADRPAPRGAAAQDCGGSRCAHLARENRESFVEAVRCGRAQ